MKEEAKTADKVKINQENGHAIKSEKVRQFKRIFMHIVLIVFIAYLNFILFSDKTFFGLVNNSILLNPEIVIIIMLILLFLLSRHLIRIKLIFYRIFLQTFLSQSSIVYKFLSHGFIVKFVAVVISAGLVIEVFIFMSLVPVHIDQYIGLCIGFIIFWIFRERTSVRSGVSFIRTDLNQILKAYLMPFLLATATGLGIATWEICHIDEIHHISGFSEALEVSLTSIDPGNNFFWQPIRVMARHIYAWEILIQQIVKIELIGPIFYFVFLIISQGSITFFSIFLMAMPYKKEKHHENG